MKKLFLSLIFLMVFESISAKDLRNQLAIDIPGVMTKVTDWRHHFHEFPELSTGSIKRKNQLPRH